MLVVVVADLAVACMVSMKSKFVHIQTARIAEHAAKSMASRCGNPDSQGTRVVVDL